jgi:hypothetical protein
MRSTISIDTMKMAVQVRSWTAREAEFDDGGTITGSACAGNVVADFATAICNLKHGFHDGGLQQQHLHRA